MGKNAMTRISKHMWTVMLIMVLAVFIIFAAIFGFKALVNHKMHKTMSANQVQIITVSSAKAAYQDWPQQLKATGSFSPVLGVDVTSEINGLVRAVYFKHGDVVKQNDLLVQLNPDTEIAALHGYQAQTELYRTTYNRDLAQYAIGAVSKQQLETDYANWKFGLANIEQENSIIAKKMIRAPFNGRLGISLIMPGQYINPGDKIVSLQTLDPIYVQFTLPQQN